MSTAHVHPIQLTMSVGEAKRLLEFIDSHGFGEPDGTVTTALRKVLAEADAPYAPPGGIEGLV